MDLQLLFPPEGYVNEGSRGGAVELLQQLLQLTGRAPEGLVADGDYGPLTVEGVRSLQLQDLGFKGDEADGQWGPQTATCLASMFDMRVSRVTCTPSSRPTQWVGPDGRRGTWPPEEPPAPDDNAG